MACRRGQWTKQTSGSAPGFVQGKHRHSSKGECAVVFRLLQEESKDMSSAGHDGCGRSVPRADRTAADLSTDVPMYCIYERGVLREELDRCVGNMETDKVRHGGVCALTTSAQFPLGKMKNFSIV